jgi:hypothetical protein
MPTKTGVWMELKKVNDKPIAATTGMTIKIANNNQ